VRAHAHVDDKAVRRWLANLRRPERLDDPALAALLRAHGRATHAGLRGARDAAAFLREKIDALRPAEGAPSSEQLPHRVLTMCFVEGRKSFQAAARLGLSERQISRERARAVALLAAELRGGSLPQLPAASVPAALLPRPGTTRRLEDALRRARRVHVTGGAGAGKTTLVDAWSEGCSDEVRWHSFTPGLPEGLAGLLFELGDRMAPGDPSLDSYMRAALPRPDLALGARIALASLVRAAGVLVLDDFDAVRDDAQLAAFLHAVEALRSWKIVTVGRLEGPRGIPRVTVPPLSADEVAELLALREVSDAAGLAPRLHGLTGGNARSVDAAAAWLSHPGDGADGLLRATTAAVVPAAAHLMWSVRRRAA
jgi:hypothetical protein